MKTGTGILSYLFARAMALAPFALLILAGLLSIAIPKDALAEMRINTLEGNPVNAVSGNKFQDETDYAGAAQTGISLHRYYNSQALTYSAFGANWSSSYSSHITVTPGSLTLQSSTSDGRTDVYEKTTSTSTTWVSDPDVTSKLVIVPATGAQTGWQITRSDDSVELYTLDGRLGSITTRAGLKTTLAYDTSNRLSTVTGPFGHKLTFAYTANNLVSQVTAPDGGIYKYTYDANKNLTSVTYPNAAVRKYAYETTVYPNAFIGQSFPALLTGIVDEKGVRYATFTYDGFGQAIATQHAGGADKVTFEYDDSGTDVTDARGNAHSYAVTLDFSTWKPTETGGAPVPNMGGRELTYDTNGFIASRTDFNGNKTTYTNDTRGNELTRVEAAGTALARTITTTWHATFHLPLTITEPGSRVTTFTYDAHGNMLTKKVAVGTLARIWTYTYNAAGQVLTINGPRTDVSDITTFTYDAKGDLASVKDALGHITSFTSYDANGRLLSMTDPNGLVTAFTYNPRGHVLTRTAGTEKTTTTYDANENLTGIALPDASATTYTYDAAHRLTGVTDRLGNRIVYTLDLTGNVTAENVYNPAAVIVATRTHTYDSVNHLLKDIGALGQATSYTYDLNGNLTLVTDPLAHATRYAYDALNRLQQTINPLGFPTSFTHDALDRLTQVADPRGLKTSYAYDGLDDQTARTSPDTGAATRSFDAAGNVLTSTDARAAKATFVYDALGRVTRKTYSDGKIVAYAYDQGAGGIGHLTAMTDPTGSTAWTYDAHGRVLTRVQKPGTLTFTTRYTYNALGQLASMTYPSGKLVTYAYDADGRVVSITSAGVALVSAITYQPFGPVAGWHMGNGKLFTRTFDKDGRVAAQTSGALAVDALAYDNDNNLIKSAGTGLTTGAYTYDANSQQIKSILTLTTPSGTASAERDLIYDGDGNQTYFSRLGANQFNYTYPATSNRLTSLAGTATIAYTYDAAGNRLKDSIAAYTYDARGRLATATASAVATAYGTDGLDERVSKTGAAVSTGGLEFVYDEAGHIAGEYTRTGGAVQETIWLGDLPVAVTEAAANYYISPDQLGAPRVIQNQAGANVWLWERTPLASNAPTATAGFSYNLRMPGQYFDAETGLLHNGYRDLDTAYGMRYLESDPIGLGGGNNTYIYALNNPVNLTDPMGQSVANVLIDVVSVCMRNPFCYGPIGVSIGHAVISTPPRVSDDHIVYNEDASDDKGAAGKTCPAGAAFPDRPLPRDPETQEPVPDDEAEGPYTQLGTKDGRSGKYPQGREFDENGNPVKDIDFTDHGRPDIHTNPHQHEYVPNPTGGTPQRSDPKPVE